MVFTITFMISVHKASEVHGWSGHLLLQVSPEIENAHIEIQWILYWLSIKTNTHLSHWI